MKIQIAQRIRELPPYLFARIDELKAEQRKKGVDLIDLGIGDPDLPTPGHIVGALQQAGADPGTHRYPSYAGMPEMRRAACDFMKTRFGVSLDPGSECVALIGSKEGIAHLPVALVDPGDVVLVPDPGYPVYATGTKFSGGEVHYVRLERSNGFLPKLDAIPTDVAKRAKLIWVNYPNNPTAALAPRSFYEELLAWAREHNVIVASDLAYSEMYFDEADRPASVLEFDGAKDLCIEFHSLSKTYNMTGWRVGFAVGNRELVGALGKVKTNVDSGVFDAVQRAAIAALSGDQSCVAAQRKIYQERVDILCDGLSKLGFDVIKPRASFYCLISVPKGMTSLDYAGKLIEAGVVAAPATGFGPGGEGYVRLTVCADKARLEEAVRRLGRVRAGG